MAITIERILCPVDFTEYSRRALEHAMALAAWYDARVEVLHVAAASPDLGLADAAAQATSDRPPHGPAALETFVRPVREAQVRAETRLDVGEPVRVIQARAQAWPADLIVMATHGAGGYDRLLLGAISERVLRTAPCPVLTVPPAIQGAAVPPLFARRILCPMDFSAAALSAFEYALSLARESDGHVTLLHVVEGFADEATGLPDVRLLDLVADRVRAAQERLDRLVPADAADWCEVETRVTTGKPYREIRRLTAELGIDLIVMGVVGRDARDLLVFGSMTHHVVREAACPVLTIRPTRTAPESLLAGTAGLEPLVP